MGTFIPGFGVDSEVTMYLTLEGLKPASHVTLQGILLYNEERERRGQSPDSPNQIITISEEAVHATETFFRSSSLLYYLIQHGVPKIGTDVMYESKGYCIARTNFSLGRLIHAFEGTTNNSEMGLALGYPEDAVSVYGLVINGQKRVASYVYSQIDRAREVGIDIPSWVLYLDHIPAELDFVQGRISKQSKAQCMRYEELIRRKYPLLAQQYESMKRELFFRI